MYLGNIDVFPSSITITSSCKRCLERDTGWLIPTGGYTCNYKCTKKALKWLRHMKNTDGVKVKRGRNGREYSLPVLSGFSVVGYCPETRTFYEFFCYYYDGHT